MKKNYIEVFLIFTTKPQTMNNRGIMIVVIGCGCSGSIALAKVHEVMQRDMSTDMVMVHGVIPYHDPLANVHEIMRRESLSPDVILVSDMTPKSLQNTRANQINILEKFEMTASAILSDSMLVLKERMSEVRPLWKNLMTFGNERRRQGFLPLDPPFY